MRISTNKTFLDTRYGGQEVRVILAQYAGGEQALLLEDAETGEPWATVSVNLKQAPPKGCVWVKGWSENEGLFDLLVRNMVLDEKVEAEASSGFVVVTAHRIVSGLAEDLLK